MYAYVTGQVIFTLVLLDYNFDFHKTLEIYFNVQ